MASSKLAVLSLPHQTGIDDALASRTRRFERLKDLRSPADLELMLVLERLRPQGLREDDMLDYSISSHSTDSCSSWVQLDSPGSSSRGEMIASDVRRATLALAAAQGVEREIAWYFSERSTRVFSWRRNPVSSPDARTVFARQLRRYASTSLAAGDRSQLSAWCTYLRRITSAGCFSASNMVWRSNFERSLEACLVRLEGLERQLDGLDEPPLPVCCVSHAKVSQAVARRGESVGSAALSGLARSRRLSATAPPPKETVTVRLERLAAARFLKAPLISGVQTLLGFQGWTGAALLAAACLELSGQVLGESRAYAAGTIDAHTFAEEVLASVGSTGGLVLCRRAAPLVLGVGIGEGLALAAVAGPASAALVECIGVSAATFLLGALVRKAVRGLSGEEQTRALRRAYTILGLSASGAFSYSTHEIESQLEWSLRRKDVDVLQLWVAYAYIREAQHPALRDPWGGAGL